MFEETHRQIQWHDMPVDAFVIKCEDRILELVFTPFNDEKDDYDNYRLTFSEIIEINVSDYGSLKGLLGFDKDYALDIFSYDLEVQNGIQRHELCINCGGRHGSLVFEVVNRKTEIAKIDS